ncbi:MAG: hypothetical protein J5715_02325 [Clostridiales bacterium]|nr:hypothetical protein [Clostridiales bacterium]
MDDELFNMMAAEASGVFDSERRKSSRGSGFHYSPSVDAHAHMLNMRIANYLAVHGSDEIGKDEFFDACVTCNVDPYSITQADIEEIRTKLKELT